MGILDVAVTVAMAVSNLVHQGQGISPEVAAKMKSMSIYDFTMKDIDGKDVKLSKFKGKAMLIVNVASKCGNTPQYEGLQKIYAAHQKDGLVVLGFPANEFRGQEPGTNAEIKEFCTATYGVTFPMFSKIVVKGDGIHPLYQWLLAHTDPAKDIDWNFAKFLVSKDGKTVQRFSARLSPLADEFTEAVKNVLSLH
jgi:glutathione peroxidase